MKILLTFEDFSAGNDVFHDVVTTNNVDYTETPNDGIVNNAVHKAQYYMFMGRSPSYTGPRDTLPFGFIFFNTEEENGLISDFVPIVDGYNAYGDISSVGSKGVHVDHHNIIFLPKDSASGTFNVINGNAGNDLIDGAGGADNINAGAGDDTIVADGSWTS